jgi:hypothetical protein
VGRLDVTDWETKGGGKGLIEDSIKEAWLVQPERSSEDGLRLADFDVNIVDAIITEDRAALDGHLDALFGRERARLNSNEDDGGRGRLAGYANAKGGHTVTLDPHPLQMMIHGRTDSALPDLVKTMRAERRQLLEVQRSFRILRPLPDIGTRTSNQAGPGWQTVEVVSGFEVGRRFYSRHTAK